MPTDDVFDEFVELVAAYPTIRGRETIVQLVAIGAAESGLDNLAVGNNAVNGTPSGSPAFYSLGLGWLQHDSYWLEQDRLVNGIDWSIEAIRADPVVSLDLIVARPGFVLHQGTDRTYIRFGLWNVWPRKSDEFVPAAEAAYRRVTGG